MSNYLTKVKKLIEDKFGVDPSEINEESYFEDDLNIGAMELMEFLSELEEELKIDLVEDKDEIESVGDLVDLISEKLD